MSYRTYRSCIIQDNKVINKDGWIEIGHAMIFNSKKYNVFDFLDWENGRLQLLFSLLKIQHEFLKPFIENVHIPPFLFIKTKDLEDVFVVLDFFVFLFENEHSFSKGFDYKKSLKLISKILASKKMKDMIIKACKE